jgi:hypothetical protein
VTRVALALALVLATGCGADARLFNRLAGEASPYLRQHALNPVAWWPWGEAAFAEARRRDVPIFLSIGYSTCHWCHVMAHESFEDPAIARALDGFVAIKVDREERPDVDAAYMAAAEAMGAPTGWPLNLWLTPEGVPFLAVTYLPPRDGDRGIRVGLASLLATTRARWRDERAALLAEAAATSRALAAQTAPAATAATAGLDATPLHAVLDLIERFADRERGGLLLPGQRARFPSDFPVRLALRLARREADPEIRALALAALDAMAAGGLHDPIGGGFHRYTVDPAWRVPHFEKMLSDNALLALAYADGYRAAGRPQDLAIARETLAFVDRELGLADGGFASALDAGGPGEEGAFYAWTRAEVDAAAGADAALVAAHLGIGSAGNLEDGRSAPARVRAADELAAAFGVAPDAARAAIARGIAALRAARDRRPRPRRDDKAVAAWNGLAISAFVQVAELVDDPAEAAALRGRATRAAEALAGRIATSRDGRLARATIDGRAIGDAILDDLALAGAGFLDLYEATGDVSWFAIARGLAAQIQRDFARPDGGYFLTRDAGPLGRLAPTRDGAEPSGNAATASFLLRLHHLMPEDPRLDRVDRLLAWMAPGFQAPLEHLDGLAALEARLDGFREVVLVAPRDLAELAELRRAMARRLGSARVVALAIEGRPTLLSADKAAQGGRPTAYVCTDGACRMPTSDPAVFGSLLDEATALPPGIASDGAEKLPGDSGTR